MSQRLVEYARCKNCSRQTLLLPETLEGTFEYQIGLLKDAPPIAISCMHCKHVYSYHGHDWEGGLILEADNPYAHPASLSLFVMRIKCDDNNCCSRLQVVAPRAMGMTDKDVQAEIPTWTWHDLKCPSGHPISIQREKNES